MAKEFVKVVLKSGKDQSLLRFHPWVFSGAIKKMYGTPAEGELVKVYSNKDQFLGIGHYQVGSIAIRIVSFEEIEPDYDFWKSKIESAWNLRKKLGFENNPETNVFRLIHAEGDGMPGLIVDFYNGTAVMQMHSIGMYLIREELVKALTEVMGDQLKAIYNKSEKTLPFKAEVKSEDGYLFGSESETEVKEYGLRFKVDWEKGQKTGFFVDQRENRKLVQDYSKDRDVLNMFCYTGGFSFYAMKGDAKSVHSVDASAKAIDLTDENVELNFPGDKRHKSTVIDGFEYLKDIQDKYDLIILDPPAFAKHRNTLPQALKGYKRINTRAFEQIRKGGILFTFSCSQVVSKEKFREAVFSAAAIAGRNVRILHQMSQPVDHPVNIYHPESEYLKGLVLYVE
ncbi:class I SAM-dependent rRNA methyltransferase [Draconibacterium sp. IB214405]|uniref:class I SAM-dependent rRNA methyltransferase n=1 Tax=Draconibacterium sp. IB214405 TaxID=3097352 RepID=UPI002A17A643|nr:class I SAM-dependent rRNA methyltransferase [Draconibacterium sp. IB214405]MDX8340380.1 class I SAM-dependent rRNA methyltransferase [Draconibacterium sp. IB214405]